MSGRDALALVAGFGSGMMAAQRQKKEDEQRDADRAFTEEQRARLKADQQREDAVRAGLAEAAAPVWADAADDNAVAGRQAGVYAKYGMPAQAAEIRRGARADRIADAQETALSEAKARDKMFRSMAQSYFQGGLEGLSEHLTKDYDDGLTYDLRQGADGKVTALRKDVDGKTRGSMQFDSPLEALQFAVGRADPSKYIEYAVQRADKKQAQANADRTFELQSKVATAQMNNSAAHLALAQASGARADNAAAARGDAAGLKLPKAVELAYGQARTAAQKIDDAILKAKADGTWDPKSEGGRSLMLERQGHLDKMGRLLQPYLKEDDPLAKLLAAEDAPAPAAAPAAARTPAAADPVAVALQKLAADAQFNPAAAVPPPVRDEIGRARGAAPTAVFGPTQQPQGFPRLH